MYHEALENGFLRQGHPTEDEIKELQEALLPKKADFMGLRYPERDAKTEADFMRLTFQEEDEAWRKEQERLTITVKEQKKLPREVLTDTWEEDYDIYKHKRNPWFI